MASALFLSEHVPHREWAVGVWIYRPFKLVLVTMCCSLSVLLYRVWLFLIQYGPQEQASTWKKGKLSQSWKKNLKGGEKKNKKQNLTVPYLLKRFFQGNFNNVQFLPYLFTFELTPF